MRRSLQDRKDGDRMNDSLGIERVGKWTYARLIERVDVPERKTRLWIICANDGEVGLGEVKWRGKWRCYAYFPIDGTIYEKQCLRDIADFCEAKTTEHRNSLKQ